MLDVERVRSEYEVAAIVGNSMGWYTALASGERLSFEDGFQLVQRMSMLQEEHGSDGGQMIHPLVDEDWRLDCARLAAVERLVAEHPDDLFHSIRLGGYAVLAGTRAGLAVLSERLEPVQQGKVTYPFRLALRTAPTTRRSSSRRAAQPGRISRTSLSASPTWS